MVEGTGLSFEALQKLPHQLFSKEKEARHKLKLIDLTNGTEESLDILRSQVEASKGVARVLVHPRYEPLNRIHPMTEDYLEKLDGFIHKPDASMAPLIVFEEEKEVKALRTTLAKISQAFVIRTILGYPTPATKEVKADERDYHTTDKANREVAQRFKDAGIKTLIIGGRNLFINNPEQVGSRYDFERFLDETKASPSSNLWREQGIYPKGCVGGVIENMMREGLEIQVSAAVSPDAQPLFSERHLHESGTI